MTFVITETCIDTQDQACVDVCPVDCIHFEEGKDRMLYINPVECIDCGACQPACPVTAIFPEGDVPAAQARFIEINSLWYENADAARAQVGGGAAPAAPAAAAAPAAEAAEAASEAQGAGGDAPAAAAAPAAAPAAAAKPAAAAPVAAVMQVPAVPHAASGVSTYRLPPAGSVISLAALAATVYAMFVFPGPTWIKLDWAEGLFKAIGIDNGGGVGITVVLLLPMALLLLLVHISLQFRDFGRYAASHERQVAKWRKNVGPEWRRNEESRRYELAETVQAIARDRFDYDASQGLRTYVNLPDPKFGIEVRGSGAKVFPDIVTVATGNQAVAIVQVESRETVTREQAQYVWATLENRSCPLYIYVPTGLLGRAKDYAKSAGLRNVKFRTWRWSPNGMVVKEA